MIANEDSEETSHGWTPSSAKVEFSRFWTTVSTEAGDWLGNNPLFFAFILELVGAVDFVSFFALLMCVSCPFGDNFLRFLGLDVMLEASESEKASSTEEGADDGILKYLNTTSLVLKLKCNWCVYFLWSKIAVLCDAYIMISVNSDKGIYNLPTV